MGGKCKNCGYKTCYSALEFHHTDPDVKEASWGKMRLWGWERIKNELSKCILLCSNCHREAHSYDIEELIDEIESESVDYNRKSAENWLIVHGINKKDVQIICDNLESKWESQVNF